jgi:hypothetical protein
VQVIAARRPRSWFAIVGWLARTSAVAAVIGAPAVLANETVPIEGRLDPQKVTAEVGTIVQLRLEVSTTVAFKRVAVRVRVPEGMTLVAGTAQTEIVDFSPGKNRVFEYQLRLDRSGEREIWVEADVLGISPAILRQLFRSVVNPKGDGKSAASIRRDPDGTSYQVQGISNKVSP